MHQRFVSNEDKWNAYSNTKDKAFDFSHKGIETTEYKYTTQKSRTNVASRKDCWRMTTFDTSTSPKNRIDW